MSRYTDLVRKCLLNEIYQEAEVEPFSEIEQGHVWPKYAFTMIGRHRLETIEWACENTIAHNVPGDFMEAGVWRGGACILMRAVLAEHEIADRKVVVADSFSGFPAPVASDDPQPIKELVVSLDEVKRNFGRFGLLDEQVEFVPGSFADTMPIFAPRKLAVLRADCDSFTGTTILLDTLYPMLSPGGYFICDDYTLIESVTRAVDDYRTRHNITTSLQSNHHMEVFWKKEV